MIIDKFGKEVSMYHISRAYGEFKELYNFYLDHVNIKGKMEINKRIDYIKKHGTKQKTELETLYWVLGEDIIGEK